MRWFTHRAPCVAQGSPKPLHAHTRSHTPQAPPAAPEELLVDAPDEAPEEDAPEEDAPEDEDVGPVDDAPEEEDVDPVDDAPDEPDDAPAPISGSRPDQALCWPALWLAGEHDLFPEPYGRDGTDTVARRRRRARRPLPSRRRPASISGA